MNITFDFTERKCYFRLLQNLPLPVIKSGYDLIAAGGRFELCTTRNLI